MANIVALLDPELIVVGGAAAQAGQWLLQPAREELDRVLEGARFRKAPPVVAASAGPLAGAIGAALLAADGAAGEQADTSRLGLASNGESV